MKYEIAPVNFEMIPKKYEIASMDFEIAPKETETYLTWDEAMIYCQSLKYNGGGWRLPNRNELNMMILSNAHEMQFEERSYWSSAEDDRENSWVIYFYSACTAPIICPKTCISLVRAIRNKS